MNLKPLSLSFVLLATCASPQEASDDQPVPAPVLSVKPRVATLADRPPCVPWTIGGVFNPNKGATVHVDADNSAWRCHPNGYYVGINCSNLYTGTNFFYSTWDSQFFVCGPAGWQELSL